MAYVLVEYFEALDRLKNGTPKLVPRGTKITNDSVALEAGRGKGTIKKSRPMFQALISDIDEAGLEQKRALTDPIARLRAAKDAADKYRALWEEAVCREASLVQQLWSERQEWARKEAALTGAKVSSIHSKRRQK